MKILNLFTLIGLSFCAAAYSMEIEGSTITFDFTSGRLANAVAGMSETDTILARKEEVLELQRVPAEEIAYAERRVLASDIVLTNLGDTISAEERTDSAQKVTEARSALMQLRVLASDIVLAKDKLYAAQQALMHSPEYVARCNALIVRQLTEHAARIPEGLDSVNVIFLGTLPTDLQDIICRSIREHLPRQAMYTRISFMFRRCLPLFTA